MKKVILVRYGEIALKGINKPVFEDKLIKNMKKALYRFGQISVIKSQSRIYIEPVSDDYEFSDAISEVIKVFGIVSVSPVWKIESDYEEIKGYSLKMVNEILEKNNYKTFKVEAKRGNKKFPMDSPEICRELGGHILENIPGLSVDVKNPDFVVYVEVRESTYIYSEKFEAFGGMPTGTNGKAMLLLSGGIDSPVAGFMIGKRGVEIEAVHFYSYPYTSERAKDKVIELAKIMSAYVGRVRLHIVPFTDIQLHINDNSPEDHLTVLMRRAMMRISEVIAEKNGAMALVTGESIGQVASQTMHALVCTNAVVKMPIFRPLIGMDKNEVIAIAKKIETFETSILPYEDCCTVFVAKHPNTKPKLDLIEKYESKLQLEELINKAIEETEVITL